MRSLLGLMFLVFVMFSCASAGDSDLEECLFNLDGSKYDAAVSACQQAQATNPNSDEAAMLLSSAYVGRGHIDVLELVFQLEDSAKETTAFKEVNRVILDNVNAAAMSDLRLAIDVLENFGTSVVDTENFYGQLAMFQSLEAFALPTVTAKPTAGSVPDPSAITPAIKDIVQSDMLQADDLLLNYAGWLDTNQMVKGLRRNYCVLKNVSPEAGFTTEELRDFMLCQLSDDPSVLAEDAFESAVVNCAGFNFDVCSNKEPTAE